MKNFFNYYAANNGKNVIICTDNDEVKEGKVIAQDIIMREEGNDLVALTIETEDKKRYSMSYKICYANIEDYRKNKPIELSDGNFSRIKGINDAGDKPMYYTIENGQVIMNVVDIRHIRIICAEDQWLCTSPEVPTDVQMFENPDVAEQMCVTEWTDDEGKSHVREGILSLLMPDNKQMAAIKALEAAFKALEAAFKKCIELGVGFGHCTKSYRIYAWNESKVESVTFDWGGDPDKMALIFERDVIDLFRTSMCLDNMYEDTELYIERKDEQKADE